MFGNNDPEQMKKMMQRMGVDIDEISTEKVVIQKNNGEKIVFEDADVNRLNVQGQDMYQILGSPELKGESTDEVSSESTEQGDSLEEEESVKISEDDVEVVALRAGVTEDVAREELEDTDGDLAEAITNLN